MQHIKFCLIITGHCRRLLDVLPSVPDSGNEVIISPDALVTQDQHVVLLLHPGVQRAAALAPAAAFQAGCLLDEGVVRVCGGRVVRV